VESNQETPSAAGDCKFALTGVQLSSGRLCSTNRQA
jgi:hypothetical protein